MDALQIDADDVDIAGRASQLGREQVPGYAARDLLHAPEGVDPVSRVSASRKRKKPVLMKTLY